ncbi:MAG: ABC transporter permease [Lachnospiraceae bacterium]|nr:ABC transporter permease [Lachnospiraceae bacterium]
MGTEKKEKSQSKMNVIMTTHRSEITMGGALVILFLILCVLSPNFRTTRNMTNILSQVSFTAVLALGETFIMLTGGIDLSVGSVLGVTGLIAAIVLKSTNSIFLAILAALLLGALIGTLNGVMVSYFRIPAFVVTLGTQQIFRSANYLISGGHAVNKLSDAYKAIASVEIFSGFRAYYLAIIILFFVVHWILSNTKLGRNTYAIGSNVVATRLAGVNTILYTMYPYIISGVLAAVGGILMGSRYGAVDPNYGDGYEMDVLAAVVIGGCSMTGGKGTILGTAIGVLFMGVLSNGLDITGVSPYWQGVATGTVLILALLFERITNREKD